MTPQNAGYATAAYTLAALIYLVYGASVVMRERRLRARLEELDSRTSGPGTGVR